MKTTCLTSLAMISASTTGFQQPSGRLSSAPALSRSVVKTHGYSAKVLQPSFLVSHYSHDALSHCALLRDRRDTKVQPFPLRMMASNQDGVGSSEYYDDRSGSRDDVGGPDQTPQQPESTDQNDAVAAEDLSVQERQALLDAAIQKACPAPRLFDETFIKDLKSNTDADKAYYLKGKGKLIMVLSTADQRILLDRAESLVDDKRKQDRRPMRFMGFQAGTRTSELNYVLSQQLRFPFSTPEIADVLAKVDETPKFSDKCESSILMSLDPVYDLAADKLVNRALKDGELHRLAEFRQWLCLAAVERKNTPAVISDLDALFTDQVARKMQRSFDQLRKEANQPVSKFQIEFMDLFSFAKERKVNEALTKILEEGSLRPGAVNTPRSTSDFIQFSQFNETQAAELKEKEFASAAYWLPSADLLLKHVSGSSWKSHDLTPLDEPLLEIKEGVKSDELKQLAHSLFGTLIGDYQYSEIRTHLGMSEKKGAEQTCVVRLGDDVCLAIARFIREVVRDEHATQASQVFRFVNETASSDRLKQSALNYQVESVKVAMRRCFAAADYPLALLSDARKDRVYADVCLNYNEYQREMVREDISILSRVKACLEGSSR